MEIVLLLNSFQILLFMLYLLVEFYELRSIIRQTENNIITSIIRNEISNESPKDNK